MPETAPAEPRYSSVKPDRATAAAAGEGTVSAVVEVPEPERLTEPERETRHETYTAEAPDGQLVTVRRNMETGETEIIERG